MMMGRIGGLIAATISASSLMCWIRDWCIRKEWLVQLHLRIAGGTLVVDLDEEELGLGGG